MSDYNWSQAGQGAVGGALTGAELGSVAGPWGAAIGGGVGLIGGGLMGLFSHHQTNYEDRLNKLAQGYGAMQAPQAGPAAQGAYSGFRQNQAGLISQLESMARGQGPSAAQIQMREAMDRAAGAQASAAAGAGGRGVNAGAAFRNAANNTAAIQAQGARDTATLRAQEQMNATGMLGQAVAQGRAADENMNQFNAGQTNNMSQANLNAQLQTLGIKTQAQLDAVRAAMGAQKPGIGTQLLGAGAQGMVPALQSYMGNQQAQQQMSMQQQYMNTLQQRQQAQQQHAAMRAQIQATPSTPDTGWYYDQPQSPNMNGGYYTNMFIPQILQGR